MKSNIAIAVCNASLVLLLLNLFCLLEMLIRYKNLAFMEQKMYLWNMLHKLNGRYETHPHD